MSVLPTLIASCKQAQLDNDEQNFYRQAKWCPDGSVAMAQCENRSLQIVELGSHIEPSNSSSLGEIENKYNIRLSAPVLEFAWYPGASPLAPVSYCFVVSVRECPVQLLDASDGRLRASYKIVDHRERQIAPHSIAFNPAATHLYCGFEDAIEVFNVQRPGEGIRLATTPSKKSKDGIKGIISSLAFCTDYSGLYAASTLSGNIALYNEATGEDPVAYLDGITNPIMQVQFNPAQPHILYASQRRSNDILYWDIRNSTAVLGSYSRKAANTNQKLKFDIDLSGKRLVTGDEDGIISFFDTSILEDIESSDTTQSSTVSYHAHDDAIGSATFHPFDPTRLLSVSGSRHFHPIPINSIRNHPPSSDEASPIYSDPDSDSDSDSDELNSERDEITITRNSRIGYPFAEDASMKLWSLHGEISQSQSKVPNSIDANILGTEGV